MMKTVLRVISLVLLISLMGITLSACSLFEKFTVYSCASGFYFNKSGDKTYKIEELDVESDGNYFYLEDYFYSESLGTEYKIKRGLFNVGSVYLAKKSDHYNEEVYTFDIAEYKDKYLKITPEMNYVEITSSTPDKAVATYIQIEERELPLDLTLNNVNIKAGWGIPALFVASKSDVNLILKGENSIEAVTPNDTLAALYQRLKGTLSDAEELFYDTLRERQYLIDAWNGEKASGDVTYHYFDMVSDLMKDGMDSIVGSFENLFEGKEGAQGMHGASAIVSPAGISVSGEGSLYAKGGSGASGGDAGVGIFGTSDGGDGGNGGSGFSCLQFLDITGNLNTEGGVGGQGGEAAKGLMASGNKGAKGKDGLGVSVTNPKED